MASLETGVAFECVEFQDERLIVGQPKVIRRTQLGRSLKPNPKRSIHFLPRQR